MKKNRTLLLTVLTMAVAALLAGTSARAAEPEDWTGNYKSSDGQTIEVISADEKGIEAVYYGYSEDGWNTRDLALKFSGSGRTKAVYTVSTKAKITQTYTLGDGRITISTTGGSFDDGVYTKTDESFNPIDRFFDRYSDQATTQYEMTQTEALRSDAWHKELKALITEQMKETSYKEDKSVLDSYLTAAETQAKQVESIVPMYAAGMDVKPADRAGQQGTLAPCTIAADTAAVYRNAFSILSDSIYSEDERRDWVFSENDYMEQMQEVFGD